MIRTPWSAAILAIVVVVFTAGCATTADRQAFVSPTARSGQTTYDSFVAYAAFKDLSVAGRFEKTMCARLVNAGHACAPLLALASPTAPQDAASRQRAAERSGAEAILVIELADPNTLSRRLLADGRIGFRISLVDAGEQKTVAEFAIEPRHAHGLSSRAAAVAAATVAALRKKGLLQEH